MNTMAALVMTAAAAGAAAPGDTARAACMQDVDTRSLAARSPALACRQRAMQIIDEREIDQGLDLGDALNRQPGIRVLR